MLQEQPLGQLSTPRALINVSSEFTTLCDISRSTRNIHLYQEVLESLAQVGIHQTLAQCQEQIKHLRLQYQRAKDSSSYSRMGPPTCLFFKELARS